MDRAELKSFGKPDEVRDFLNGRLQLVKIGGATIERAVFGRPPSSLLPKQKVAKHPFSNIMSRVWCGFEWMTAANSIVSRGDVSLLPSGHDAGVVGDEPAVVVDFQGMID